jgi:Domain of unknown function (DUF1707)
MPATSRTAGSAGRGWAGRGSAGPGSASSASAVLRVAALPAAGSPRPGWRHADSELDLRISDGERTEVTDQLAHHFSAGRLDEQEFNDRLDRVMGATTYRNLSGVLHDLPGAVLPRPVRPQLPAPSPRPRRPRPRGGHGVLRVVLIALLVLFVAASARAVAWVFAPVLWIGVLCAIAVLVARGRRR